MCGARISSFPGEILYPNYQGGGGFRDNGDPRGARVTNGLWTRNKAEITYNQKRRGYFPNVRYVVSEVWQRLQDEIPQLENEVIGFRQQMVLLMNEFRAKVVLRDALGSLTGYLGLNNVDFYAIVEAAWRDWNALKAAERRKQNPVYAPGASLADIQDTDRANDDALDAARTDFENAVRQLNDMIDDQRLVNGMAGYYPWRKTFRQYVLFLHPLVIPKFNVDTSVIPGRVWDLDEILKTVKGVLAALNEVSKFAVNVFDPNSIDNTNEVSIFILFICFLINRFCFAD
jgi:hypothetical protein